MKHFSLLLLFSIFTKIVVSQAYTPPPVVPPSPQSQGFVKYIDYPVDLVNGLASTTIPLYTVISGKISLPLSLNYHASGLQPSSESGTIGLNWNFNFGGMISRSVKGGARDSYQGITLKDEEGIRTNPDENLPDPDFISIQEGSEGFNFKDWEHDVFSYVYPSQSGKFILPKTGNINDFINGKTLPYKPIKIATNNAMEYFEILDENGVFYRFGKSVLGNRNETESNKFPSVPLDHKGGVYTWLLTDIISSDKKDTISLEYSEVDVLNVNSNYIKKLTRIHNRSISFDLTTGGMSVTSPNSYSGYEYTTRILKKITFKQGYLKFTYFSEVYPNHLLNKIEIFDKSSSSPKQTIQLTQTKYHNYANRLNWNKLDKIEFFDSQLNLVNKYSFEYNTNIQFPLINDTGSKETFSVDFWGYYNGALNEDMIPLLNLPDWADYIGMRGSADRNPNSYYSQAGILNKITYPSGGTASFYYEQNKGRSNEDIGGLRIGKIVLDDGSNKQIVKSYEYFNPDHIPIQDEFFFTRNMFSSKSGNCTGCKEETFTVSSSANIDFNIFGSPVVYGKVIEYIGTKNLNIGDNLNNGWIEHYYDYYFTHTSLDKVYNRFYDFSLVDYFTTKMDWKYGDLYLSWIKFGSIFEKETKTFDASGNCKEDVKKFFSHKVIESFKNLNVRRTISVNQSNSCCFGDPQKVGCFEIFTYNIAQLKQELDSVKTWTYSSTDNNSLVTLEKFNYNNYSLVIQSEKKNSDGSIILMKTIYPSESNFSGMVSKNLLAFPIEQTSLKNGKVTNSILTLYKQNSWTYVPDKVFTLNSSEPLSSFTYFDGTNKDPHYNLIPEFVFSEYDNVSNVHQTTGSNGISTAYIWGYNQTYPVVKIEGKAYADIAATIITAISSRTFNNSTIYGGTNGIEKDVAWLKDQLSSLLNEKSCMVTFYTYSPLIGMTSQTDPNGVTTYYEYDTFGRLKCIKNDDGRILKTFEYHYKQ